MLASDPASLETLTMRPWPLARSSGRNARLACQAPSRLTSSASLATRRSAVLARCQVS
jgi:hypothetical protein